MFNEAGDRFQSETKYFRNRASSNFKWIKPPDLYKKYTKSRRLPLDKPTEFRDISLHAVLENRKSIRNFTDKPISKYELSYLLWASTGIQREEYGNKFRVAPSAGALYPIETYIVVNNVESISNGIYHYSIKNHLLEELRVGDFGTDISHAALDQMMCADSAVVFIWTAIFNRSKCKYGQRAYRYIYLDAGHIAENLALASISINLGTCQIAALYDDEVNKLIGVDGDFESTIYMSVVGNI